MAHRFNLNLHASAGLMSPDERRVIECIMHVNNELSFATRVLESDE
jgi:hypothetical protein